MQKNRLLKIFFLGFALLWILSLFLEAQTTYAPAMFPFVIPWDDASMTITDVSSLNPAPLTEQSRVVAKNSHFFDQTGRRVKFLGTNFTFNANFPNKPDAEKVVARLHKYGFNMVRMHHMDSRKAPFGLWDKAFPDTQHLDKDQLDRMDYLISQFKKQGIYVDLNLHVGREFNKADGFPDTDKLPRHSNIVTYFDPKMIQCQKDYARDLLTHFNPYTNSKYIDEPTVALIEIDNEDTLLGAAQSKNLSSLPPYYLGALTWQWNDWLIKKYKNTAALKKSWNMQSETGQPNLLANANFSQSANSWHLEKHAVAQAQLSVEDIPGSDQVPLGKAAHIAITQLSDATWHIQFNQSGLDLSQGQAYTLSFWARSAAPLTMQLFAGLDKEPWGHIGLDETVNLTGEWKKYVYYFTPDKPQPNHNRLSFVLGGVLGQVWFADFRLMKGSIIPREAHWSLQAKNLELPVSSLSRQGLDYTAFLVEMEKRYSQGMRDYIKKELKAKAMVTCSQASYGGLGGVDRESQMDYVDMHAYWQHPRFPHKPWDPVDWNILNTAMAKDASGGTLWRLAAYRVEGKPFTVSEYNHPAPSDYACEGLPMLASFALQQDWDGIFLFDYNGDRTKWNSDKIKGYFDIDTNPGKIAFMPSAARIFLGSDSAAQPSAKKVLVIPTDNLIELIAGQGKKMEDLWQSQNTSWTDTLTSQLFIRLVSAKGSPTVETTGPAVELSSQPVNLAWQDGLYSFDNPVSQGIIGFPATRTATSSPLSITSADANFLTLVLASMDGQPVRQSHSLLLTAAGKVENQNMGWNADRTSVGRDWGIGPTLCQGINAEVSLETEAAAAKVYALDSTGQRLNTVPCRLENKRLSFRLTPDYKTVWFEIQSSATSPQ